MQRSCVQLSHFSGNPPPVLDNKLRDCSNVKGVVPYVNKLDVQSSDIS